MKKQVGTQVLIGMLALLSITYACCSCGPTDTQGNLSGQVVDSNGQGVGFIAVALINVKTGKEIQRQKAQGNGRFNFKKLKKGTYTLKIFNVAGIEIPISRNEINLVTVRAKNITVTMLQEEKKKGPFVPRLDSSR